jgi:serine/threonine protein kinase
MSMNKSVIFETTFNHYTGAKIIGQGGAGRVYQATDDAGNMYAIKLLDAAKPNSEKMKRFKNEVEFCRRNQHQNIITVYDHGVFIDDKKHSPFYVMPLYKGSLRTLLATGILPEKVPVYFAQLLDGVEAAHLQRVIHRDLKPENVLYDEDRDLLLIADFGIARFEEEALYTAVETSPNARLANFQYAAPEQRSRGIDVDHRADIYALGLILNEMFTGKVPHGTGYKTISSVASDYGYLDEIVSSMLRQSAVERPGSIEEVKQELIGRKQEFVTRQRISELKQMVVPVTDLDDPLISNPPRLVNFDYEPGVLILFFQQSVNAKWIDAFHNIARYASVTSVMGKGPERFSFSGDSARIPAQESEVQQIIDFFKAWLSHVNRVYAGMILREKQEVEEQQRKQLQKEIEEQERCQRIRASVKI